MKRFFKAIGVFFRAFPGVILFELMYKLLLTALGVPLLTLIVRSSMKSAGISYLSAENLGDFLLSPVTWIAVPGLLLVMAFFSIVELSALTACYACRFERKKITVTEMLKVGLRSFVRAFRGTGILSFLGFMLVIPLAQFTMTSGVFLAPMLPMLRSLAGGYGQWLYILLASLIQLLVTALLVSRSYSLHYLVLTDCRFPECTKHSREALNGKKLVTALEIILCGFLLIAITAAAAFVMSFAVIFCIRGFSEPSAAAISSLRILSFMGQLLAALSTVISAPVVICFLTSKFLKDAGNTEKLILPDFSEKRHSTPVRIGVGVLVTAVSIFLNFSYIQQIYKGNTDINLGIFTMPRLTAHRGFSYAAPENTIYAFEEAIRIGSDYIELDVQQSADGKLVVIHDTTLDRTTDGTGKVSDYTYEELSGLSCGSWFRKGDFSDAGIMLLEEVLELADGEILLNIEIKKDGNEEDTARKAAELLELYDMTDSCYITSFSYQALKAAKKTDSSIKTGLITNVAAAAVYSQLRDIDAVSVNYIFVNQNVVSSAHRSGKQIFVWTVNKSDDIERMISLGVDNIITDRPDIAAETVYSYGRSDLVLSVIKSIFGT